MRKLRKHLMSLATVSALVGASALAAAGPAQASSHMYWFGTKASCNAALDKARPGFGSFVRLTQGCVRNGNGYAYTVAWRDR